MTIEKFKLLCWKNFTLQKRHPIAGLFEIIFPILIVVIFTYARSGFAPTEHPELKWQSSDPANYNECRSITYDRITTIGFSPSGNAAIRELVELIGKKSGFAIETFDNATELNSFLFNQNKTAGIEFEDELAVSTINILVQLNLDDIYFLQNSADLPKHLKYKIRLAHDNRLNTWLTDKLFTIDLTKTARDPASNFPSPPPYNSLCFLTIQNEIERAFIKSITKKEPPRTVLQRFPYPKVLEDVFLAFAGPLFPFLLVCCLFMSTKSIIKVSHFISMPMFTFCVM